MPAHLPFGYPFARNHCAVMAWTHLRGGGVEEALQLAALARTRGLLSRAGYARFGHEETWAALAGLTIVRQVPIRARGWTLAAFVRAHPQGRYLVATRNHFVALCEGTLCGFYRPLSRVVYFVEVTC